jgi:hypothetical protein
MSYYQNPSYDGYSYEYTNYGNYDNGNHNDAYNEYVESYSDHGDLYPDCGDPYPDHAESPYSDPDPTNSEPNYYEDHEDTPEGHEYEHEGEVGGYELRELECDEDGRDEHREREYEREHEEARYEPKGLKYERDEGYEHEELVHEPKRSTEASYAQHGTETDYAGREPIGFDRNIEQTSEYVPPIPFLSSPNPPPTPHVRDAPRSNQQGHVTASEYHTYAFDDGHNNDGYEPQLVYHKESGEYVHPCFLAPAQIPHTLSHLSIAPTAMAKQKTQQTPL